LIIAIFNRWLSLRLSGASIKNVIDSLRDALNKRQVLRIDDPKMKVSAVLVPVFLKKGRYHLLFIQRTERVKDHKGQISFPGGSYKKADQQLLNTALREAEEEIGLASEDVLILGELDDTPTATSNYVITPFIGLIPYPYHFKPDKWETEELLEVPIASLQDKKCYSESITVQNGQKIETCFYRYGEIIIWGATAKILKQFLEIYDGLGIS
jgi:8-oxo-dGTP pyrophosphatase MutT (NUDIX family)